MVVSRQGLRALLNLDRGGHNHSTVFPGGYGEEVTPVPIPNTEVKGLSGDGTVGDDHGRVARCREYSWGLSEQSESPFSFCAEQG